MIAKDEYEIKEWKKYLASSGVKLDTVDVSMGLSNVLAVKDDDAVVGISRGLVLRLGRR